MVEYPPFKRGVAGSSPAGGISRKGIKIMANKIIICVEGGVVTSVFSDSIETDVTIVDIDNLREELDRDEFNTLMDRYDNEAQKMFEVA